MAGEGESSPKEEDMDYMLQSFAKHTQPAHLPDGSTIETLRLGDLTVSKITLQPGWTWEEYVKPLAGTETCQVAHNQIIISGTIEVTCTDGTMFTASAGDVLTVEPGHTARVVGSVPAIVYDFAFGTANIADLIPAGGA
jgi:quercetin dioxygenase-like cupin family protein